MIYLGNQQVGLNNSQNNEFVSYIEDQELTNVQKERARNNIGAASTEDIENTISDIQIDGTSIVDAQGVANVPMATANNYGVVKLGSGLRVQDNTKIAVAFAAGTSCKEGTNNGQCITPSVQNSATFYGLAKAAGDTTQSQSSNPVGQYTDAAKRAICNMLGTECKMRLLKVVEITEETNVIGFDTDLNGLPFQVDKIEVYVYMKKASASSKDVTIGIETTEITPTGDKWVCKLLGISSTANGYVGSTTIVRDDYRWKAMNNVYSASSDDFSGLWQSSGSSRSLNLNGASWIRANNPLYTTALSACITDINFPVGTRFEFYAHDYQG